MIKLEDGLTRGGRCICGNQVGFILDVGKETYRIRWIDGNITTQIRPDLDEDEDFFIEEEAVDRQAHAFDRAHDHRKNWR